MKIGVVGGAGFIGHHAVRHFAQKGYDVVSLDDYSRAGSREHAGKLLKQFPEKVHLLEADITKDTPELLSFAKSCDAILHLAAQVAVTLSVSNPRRDFEINAMGTFNLLEACRKAGHRPMFIYSSTNKVYGGMEDVRVVERNGRYAYEKLPHGASEEQQLDFHSPYGCSKGAADQYVRDYSRIYDLPSVVMRQSCIYGSEQFGHEDQGWVAHITLCASRGKPVKIFGDGKQVRDVLYVEDLVDLYERCFLNMKKVRGEVFNVGGGSENTLSLIELVRILEEKLGRSIKPSFHDWRPGDQKVFVCDIRKVSKALDWKPKVTPPAGVQNLINWIRGNEEEIEKVLGTS